MKNENCPTWSPEASSDFLRSPTPNQTLQIGDPNSISQRSNTWFNLRFFPKFHENTPTKKWGFATTPAENATSYRRK